MNSTRPEAKKIQLPLKKRKENGEIELIDCTVKTPTLKRMEVYNEIQSDLMALNEAQVATADKYRIASQTVAVLQSAPDEDAEKIKEAEERAAKLRERANSLKSDMYELMVKRTLAIVNLPNDGDRQRSSDDIDWDESEGPILNEASDFFFTSMLPSQNKPSA